MSILRTTEGLQVIPKDEIRESLGKSPGRGDAWQMLQWAFNQKYKKRVQRRASRTHA